MVNTVSLSSLISKEEINILLNEADKLEVPTFDEIKKVSEDSKEIKALEFTKEELKKIKEHRINNKNIRIKVGKLEKLFKNYLNKTKSNIIDKSKDILKDVIEEENRLKLEEEKIEEKIKKDEEEKQRKIQEEIDKKINSLKELWVEISSFDIKIMSDEEFEEKLEIAKKEFEEKEKIRLEKEQKEREEKEKQEIITKINNSSSIEELEEIKEKYYELWLNFKDVEENIKNKKEILEFNLEKQKREKEEQEKKELEEKIKLKIEEIRNCENINKLEEINFYEFEKDIVEEKFSELLKIQYDKIKIKEEKEKLEKENILKIEDENRKKQEKERKKEIEKAKEEQRIKIEKINKNTDEILEKIRNYTYEEFLNFSEEFKKYNKNDFNVIKINDFVSSKIEIIKKEKKLEKQKKYQEFLKECWITEENKWEFLIKNIQEEKTIIVYKKINTFNF